MNLPDIPGVLISHRPTLVAAYSLKEGEWVTVFSGHAALYRRSREDGIGGMVQTYAHNGSERSIREAVCTLLKIPTEGVS